MATPTSVSVCAGTKPGSFCVVALLNDGTVFMKSIAPDGETTWHRVEQLPLDAAAIGAIPVTRRFGS
jgi:hypothetical protein